MVHGFIDSGIYSDILVIFVRGPCGFLGNPVWPPTLGLSWRSVFPYEVCLSRCSYIVLRTVRTVTRDCSQWFARGKFVCSLRASFILSAPSLASNNGRTQGNDQGQGRER
jgi:hypothetical protein